VKVSANNTKILRFDWTAAPDATYYKLLKKSDANSAFVQVGSDFNALTVSDPVSVHLTDWVNSRYKVQACTAADVCSDSTEVIIDSAMLSSITYLKASNTDEGDWFGWSIALSGDGKTLAVGAPAESSNATGINGDQTSNTSPTSGAVYVFVKVDGNWVQEAYLKAPNTEQPGDGVTSPLPNPNMRFGYSIALSTDGNTLVVGAINEDSFSVGVNCSRYYSYYQSSAANSSGYVIHKENYDIGAAYVFKRINTSWTQQTYIKPVHNPRGLAFGYSLALSGDGATLVISTIADNQKTTGINSSISTACIGESSNSSSSVSSSMSSSTSLSVSSSSSSSSVTVGGSNSGAVYVYKLQEDRWIEDAYIKSSDSNSDDQFGASIAISEDGKILVVGAPGEDSKDDSANNDLIQIGNSSYYLNNGGVYIFTRNSTDWVQTLKLKPSSIQVNQQFGYSVALSGNATTLAVGAPGDWTKTGGINPDGSVYDPSSESFASGAAFIFVNNGSTWVQQAYIKPTTPVPGYWFGTSVSLSGNGDVLAVGSWLDSSQAKGINGDALDTSSDDSGAAYVFKRTDTNWSQTSYVKAPNSDAKDRFGRSLDLDDSGSNLVTGAHRESSNAEGVNGNQSDNSKAAAGAVYVY
jgi:hypothetical protein